jgi:hypothetical protein
MKVLSGLALTSSWGKVVDVWFLYSVTLLKAKNTKQIKQEITSSA